MHMCTDMYTVIHTYLIYIHVGTCMHETNKTILKYIIHLYISYSIST